MGDGGSAGVVDDDAGAQAPGRSASAAAAAAGTGINRHSSFAEQVSRGETVYTMVVVLQQFLVFDRHTLKQLPLGGQTCTAAAVQPANDLNSLKWTCFLVRYCRLPICVSVTKNIGLTAHLRLLAGCAAFCPALLPTCLLSRFVQNTSQSMICSGQCCWAR